MTSIAVNAIHSGMQMDGHWTGTPSLMVQLMDHQSAPRVMLDGAYPAAEWDYIPANEIAITKLLARRNGATSPHFSLVGCGTLAEIIHSFRERHVVLFCREPARWDLIPLIELLRSAGRTVQVLTTVMSDFLRPPEIWVSLVTLPIKQAAGEPPSYPHWPSEVLACIRWRSDLDRAEALYSHMAMVWLRPSPLADEGIYRQCIAVATKHLGWRVTRKPSL